LIQGYDYYWLWKNKGCRLQLAGSDQWGNMTTGLELIRRMDGGEAHLLTCPLITKADGTKFGKTEDGALWIDKNLTSPYQFYQYWINASDEDVKKYIRMLTFLDEASILEMEAEQAKDPSQRILQKALGKEITSIVHSDEDYRAAMSTSDLMFGKTTPDTLKNIAPNQWENVFRGIPTFKVERAAIEAGAPVLNLLAELTSIFPSKGEARKMLSGGGVALNLEKISSIDLNITTDHLIQNKYMVVQKGKKNYHLIIVE
jgi:tyrosyl-tRNA synthetase